MELFNIPPCTKAIIFDIDGTLYTNKEYVEEQVNVQIRHYAKLKGITYDKAKTLIEDYRKNWSLEHNGKKISLGNTFIAFGISIEESIKWRDALMRPEDYLAEDKKLKETLLVLKETCKLLCVTNNPVQAARRTLKAIGIDTLIPDVIGLDTCKKSKPSKEMLEKALLLRKKRLRLLYQ